MTVGKPHRPFQYDLNHTPYDYTVKVMNRFKGLDLMECLKNYGQRFIDAQDSVTKTIQRKRNARRQGGCLSRLYTKLRKEEKQKAREKGKDIHN